MEILFMLAAIVVVVAVIAQLVGDKDNGRPVKVATGDQYFYGRKVSVMTSREAVLFKRLEQVTQGRYRVFPQLHLSALMTNQTKGKYWKAGFQRINRRSVDYVLCDKETMAPVYAVELDDSTHDTERRRARDAIVEDMLESVGIPLVRFRNVESMTDDHIIEAFRNAARR